MADRVVIWITDVAGGARRRQGVGDQVVTDGGLHEVMPQALIMIYCLPLLGHGAAFTPPTRRLKGATPSPPGIERKRPLPSS